MFHEYRMKLLKFKKSSYANKYYSMGTKYMLVSQKLVICTKIYLAYLSSTSN